MGGNPFHLGWGRIWAAQTKCSSNDGLALPHESKRGPNRSSVSKTGAAEPKCPPRSASESRGSTSAGVMREMGEIQVPHREMRFWENESLDCGGVSVFQKDQLAKPQKQYQS